MIFELKKVSRKEKKVQRDKVEFYLTFFYLLNLCGIIIVSRKENGAKRQSAILLSAFFYLLNLCEGIKVPHKEKKEQR